VTAADDAACLPAPAAPPLDREDAERLAARLKALGDPTRLQLLSLIRESAGGEACQCDLADAFTLSQPTISHHLRILTDAGFLDRSKRGAWAWYSIPADQRDAIDGVLPARRGLTLA
jgi:ArsR family transcriptional regulator